MFPFPKPLARLLRFSFAFAALLTIATVLTRNTHAAQRPNIIVVLLDDMGWGDFSCFGNKEAQTPNVDRLAHEGIRFSQFYVNSPICSPSRCALTTGQYPQRWRITSFLNNRADNARRGVADWLDPKAPSLARTLRENGYATGHFGKWHLGGQRDVDDAPEISEYGFDASLTNFEGMGAKLLPLTMKPGAEAPGKIWADAERLGKPVTWMQRSQITGGFIDAAIPFIDRAAADGKPFYVNVWPDDVHSPFWPHVENGPTTNAASTTRCSPKPTASSANFSRTSATRQLCATTRSSCSFPTTVRNRAPAVRAHFEAPKALFTKAARVPRSSCGRRDSWTNRRRAHSTSNPSSPRSISCRHYSRLPVLRQRRA